MINVYKSGKDYKSKSGVGYCTKVINKNDKVKHLDEGWVAELSEVKAPKAKQRKKAKKAVDDDS